MTVKRPPSTSLSTGHYIRDICVYGEGDLPWIINTDSMFANKFESKTSLEALDCLEQWHRTKVLQGAMIPIERSWLLATVQNITANEVPQISMKY